MIKQFIKKNKRMVFFLAVMLIVVLSLSLIGKTSATKYVYVKDGASGAMDGSKEHPYAEIQDAIDKAADKKRNVFIYDGWYDESFTIWEDIKVVGESQDGVRIDGDDDEPVITMHDDTEIHHLTAVDGKIGVKVENGAHAIISNCSIIENEDDGVNVDEADVDEREQLEIYESYIARNGDSGLYSEYRKIILEDNLVENNGKDGVDFDGGVEAYLKDNKFKDNAGVGLKLAIDDSDIYIKENTFYDNDRDGVEVDAFGGLGYVHFKDNKFYKNEKWALARVEKRPFSDYNWDKSLVIDGSIFWKNEKGNISHIINVY